MASVVGPDAVEEFPRLLRVGSGWASTLVVTGYPAEVGLAWLDSVLRANVRLDAALHIDPLPPATAAAGLRKARARLEATRRLDAGRGRLGDPLTAIAAEDAADLADRLARGQTRLFRVGVYLTVHAATRAALAEAVAQVQAAAASVLLDTRPATWRHLQGWASTLPLGQDGLGMRRVFDTDALALAFPLASSGLPGPLPGQPASSTGVLLGVTDPVGAAAAPLSVGPSGATAWRPYGGGVGVVWWDRWAQHNHNSLVLARSGAGKSYLVKLEILRSLYDDVHVAVIDPDDEYAALAQAVGGARIALGRPGVRVNPFDLPPGERRPDALTRRALFLHTLVGVLLGIDLPPAERSALDNALTVTYASAGITHHPATWSRPAPMLRDLAAVLARAGSRGDGGNLAAATLAARLQPWTTGSFRYLFDGPTTTAPVGRLVVWSTRHLPDELRAAGMLIALDALWRDVDTPTDTPIETSVGTPADASPDTGTRAPATYPAAAVVRSTGAGGVGERASGGNPWIRTARTPRGATVPDSQGPSAGNGGVRAGGGAAGPCRRLVVVDEAWTLLRDGEGARFLLRLAKSARKRNAGLTVVTQDVADLLGSDVGQAVAANAATQILMRQAPQAIDAVAGAFALTSGEAQMLLAAGRGQALLVAGAGNRVSFRVVASAREHALATTGVQAVHPSALPEPDIGPPSVNPYPVDPHPLEPHPLEPVDGELSEVQPWHGITERDAPPDDLPPDDLLDENLPPDDLCPDEVPPDDPPSDVRPTTRPRTRRPAAPAASAPPRGRAPRSRTDRLARAQPHDPQHRNRNGS